MTRTSLLPTLTAACALSLALSFGASAQPPVASKISGLATAEATSTDAASAEAVTVESKPVANDRNCIRDTGSLIRQRTTDGKHACLPVAGRSYSREDLQRTGATSTADALRSLDSSVR